MPKVTCKALWCDKNDNEICQKDEIILTYDEYDQFWCDSNIMYNLTQEERRNMSMKEYMEVRKKHEST